MTEIVKYFVSEIGNWVFERKEERNSRYKIGNDVRAMDVPVYPSLVYLYPVWVKYRLIRCLPSFSLAHPPCSLVVLRTFHNLVVPVDTTCEESSTGDGQEDEGGLRAI